MPDAFVFTRLYLPRPLETQMLDGLLTRLVGSDIPRPISLEVVTSAEGVVPVLGCAPTGVQRLKRLLTGLVPGVGFEAATRPDVAAVSRVTARPGGLPLAEVDPERILAGLYQALAARRGTEVLGIQLIVGRAHRPQSLRATPPDPLQPLGSMLLDGVRPASTDTRKRLHTHAAQARFDVTLRIGVTAESVKRRPVLTWEVFGALQPLESPGVRFSLVRDTAARWKTGRPAPGRSCV